MPASLTSRRAAVIDRDTLPTDPAPGQHGQPVTVVAARGGAWIGGGFGLFKQAPGAWASAWLVWMLVQVLLGLVPFGGVASALLMPVFAGGMLAGCDASYRGGHFRFGTLFHCFSDGHLADLVVIGLLGLVAQILIVVVVVILGAAPVIADVMQGGLASAHIDPLAILVAIVVGLILVVPVFMALWFAPVLIVVRGDSPVAALKSSLSACWRNPAALTVYGLLALLMLVVAIIPLGLGLLIAGPTLTASVYMAQRDVYPQQPETRQILPH